MDVVTRLIWRTDGLLCTWLNGDVIGRTRDLFEKAICEVPDEPYQVIYALNNQGQCYVNWGAIADGCGTYVAVCFLPGEWNGKRVNRYVVPLSAARRGK